MARTYQITIKGMTPLLMHRFPFGETEDIIKKRTGTPNYELEAEKALYRDDKGLLYQPASHIEGAIREAANAFKIAGRRGASYSKLVSSTVEVMPDAIPHEIQKWEVDARPVVIQKARIIRYRPILNEWQLSFTLVSHDEQVSEQVLKQILDHAGLYVGLGDFRPAKKGKYGKFMVTKWSEL